VLDSSGQLKALVEAFASQEGPSARASALAHIVSKWTGADVSSPDALVPSVAPSMNESKLAVLEQIYGEPLLNSGSAVALATIPPGVLNEWSEIYRQIFAIFYSSLISETYLKDLYDKIPNSCVDEQQDMTGVITELQNTLANNPEEGKQLLSEFARSMRGFGHDRVSCLPCREIFVQMDPELGWVVDTGGLPVYEHLHQGARPWSIHIEGTFNADAVRGSLTEGAGNVNGLNGNDVVYGTDRNECLFNNGGDALLVGGGGNDDLWAGLDDDILDGGSGNDRLFGGAGNDTYLFRRGSGQDIIIDPDTTESNTDTIWLGSSLTPEEVVLRRSGNNLVLKILDTSDTLTVQDYFRNDSPLNRIEQIQFMDGTLWTHDDILVEIVKPSEGDDVIDGGTGDDLINGAGGNDALYGNVGDEILYGGYGTIPLWQASTFLVAEPASFSLTGSWSCV